MPGPDFTKITEAPAQKATAEQIARLGQRYQFARDFTKGQRILEVACGTGIGLNYLTNNTQAHVVGGDLDTGNLAIARKAVPNDRQITLVQFDAQNIPFNDTSLDAVICFEALYYFPDPKKFVAEIKRMLCPGGVLVLGTVNCAWQNFHPSPYTHKYFNNVELFQLLTPYFSNVELYGGFPVQQAGLPTRMISLIKRIATKAHLIPGSLAARAYLKRIFLGPMQPIPNQITEELLPSERPVSIDPDKVNTKFKILYAVGVK